MGEGIGQVELPEVVSAEAASYYVHPSLLDAFFQVFVFSGLGGGIDNIYTTVEVDSCRFFARPGQRVWAYAHVRSESHVPGELFIGDVWVYDEQGQVIAIIEGICEKRVSAETMLRSVPEPQDNSYQIVWQPQPLPAVQPPSGRWLVFADRQGIAEELCRLLQPQGIEPLVVVHDDHANGAVPGAFVLDPSDPAAFRYLLAHCCSDGGPPPQGIVHLWSLDSADATHTSWDTLEEARQLGCTSVLHLVQAVVEAGWRELPRLVLVTQEAHRVTDSDEVAGVAQGPLWGLGRVIQNEHPEVRCVLVDIDRHVASLHALVQELAPDLPPEEVALRAGQRYIARLEPYALPQPPAIAEAALFQPEATYLITGGLGGIGLAVARWMVEHGARFLVLMGRRGITSEETARAVEALQEMGASMHIGQADVSSVEQVQAVLTHINQRMPPLRGVIHAAGIADPDLLLRESQERFARVMAPKVAGAWNLHQLTLGCALDFFVLFSSTGSTLVNFGQGSYAAANAFLDGLARHRRSQGLPALSINWGLWDSLGMAANLSAEIQHYLAQYGFVGMVQDQGLAALGQLIQSEMTNLATLPAQVTVAPMNWTQVGRAYQGRAVQPLLANRVQPLVQPATLPAQSCSDIKAALLRIDDPAQHTQLIEHYFCTQVARALGVPAARLDGQRSLQALGLDSLMALELKKRVEADLGLALPVRAFLAGDGIAHLARLAQKRLAQGLPGSAHGEPGSSHARPPSRSRGGSSDVREPVLHGDAVQAGLEPAPTNAPPQMPGGSRDNGVNQSNGLEIHDGRTLPTLALPPALTPLFGRTQPTSTLLHVATSSPLLVLQSGGQGTPCWWVHAGFGDILGYLALARYLGQDRPVYAIQAADPKEAASLYTSLPEMATTYLAILRTHQPVGPYLLGGWSFGGAVAFEMARLLWQAGEQDSTLVMLDTWLPSRPRDDAALAALFVDRACQGFGLPCPLTFAQLHQLSVEQQLQLTLQWLQAERMIDADMPIAYLSHALRIAQATTRLLHGYQPGYHPGSLTFYRAAAGMPVAYRDYGFLQDGIVFSAAQRDDVSVPGDHSTMLQEPQVRTLADHLRQVFRLPNLVGRGR